MNDERFFEHPWFCEIMDGIDVAVCVVDASTRSLRFNDAWSHLADSNEEWERFLQETIEINNDVEVPEGPKNASLNRLANTIQRLINKEIDSTNLDFAIPSHGQLRRFSAHLQKIGHAEKTMLVITARETTDMAILANRLAEASQEIGDAEMATGVLHNVGNVLNSVNISSRIIQSIVDESQIESLTKLSEIVRENQDDFAEFVENDKRGKLLPQYLQRLSNSLANERIELTGEIDTLTKNVEHIKEIVSVQQSYARLSGLVQVIDMSQVVEDALVAVDGSIVNHKIDLVKNIQPVSTIEADKHKVLQILVNLLTNAKDALTGQNLEDPRIEIAIYPGSDSIIVEVTDNGIGIGDKNLSRIFQHGFTTKKNGHGFGLHSCARSAQQLGGILVVESAGSGCGATFRLTLPVRPVPPSNPNQAKDNPQQGNSDSTQLIGTET